MDCFVQGRTETIRWQCAESWGRALFGPAGLRLAEWLAEGCVEVVKHGPHRSVYRVRSSGREFYVKHFRCHTVWDRVRHLFRHSQARREWFRAEKVAERGIATIQPIAWQEEKGNGPVGESFLVTEAIPGACSLEEYHRRHSPKLPPEERRAVRGRLLADFAQFLAQIHRAGVRHNDLHSGNVVLSMDHGRPLTDERARRYRMQLIDVSGVRFSGPLAWPTTCACLAVLDAAWQERLSRFERYRFWKTYLAARPELRTPRLSEAIGQLERRTETHRRRRWRRRDRRTLRTSHDFLARRTGGRRAHGVSELSPEAFLELSDAPAALLWRNMHQPVKLDRGSVIVEAELPLGERAVHVAYKRYRPRKSWKVLLAPFRPARAVQSWQRGHGLRLREIATARPVLAIHCRRPWYRAESYLAVEWIEGSENLHLYLWRVGNEPNSVRIRHANRCAESLGRLIGRMHARRAVHGDLKASNLLVVERETEVASWLVDADDVRLDVETTLARRAADLARLAASLEAHPWIPRSVRIRFLRSYLKEGGRDRVEWKALWRAVARRGERITRRKRRKKQAIL